MDSTAINHGAIVAGGMMMATKAHNLVNSRTDGFKPVLQSFLSLSYNTTELGNGAIHQGNGVRSSQTLSSFAQGNIEANKSNLDVAIQGKGLFILNDEEGNIFYTRNGAFIVNADSILVHAASGYQVGAQAIQITPKQLESLKIDERGKITAKDEDGLTEVEIGFLELADFPSKPNLKRERYGLFSESLDAGEEELAAPGENGMGFIIQGALENSGVDLISALIEINDLSQYMTAVGQNSRIVNKMYKEVIDSVTS